MEYRPKTTFEIRTNKRNNNYNYLNFYNNGINQSPKISSNKIRYILGEKKLFSLVDINEKITNSKGTTFPNQYKRLSQDEINKQFGMDKLEGWNYNRLLINKYVKRIQTSKSSFNSKNSLDGNELPSIEKKKSKIKSISQPKQVSNKDNFLNFEKQSNKNLIKNDINSKTSINILNNSINDENKINNNNLNSIKKTKNENKLQYIYPTNKRNDRWMPKNYQNYELLVKNPNLLYHKLKEDSIKRKIPFFNSKEISQKMNDTDVFFVKNKIIQNNSLIGNKKNNSTIYTSSDIFGLKNDKVSLSKCGETYLFKENLKAKYTSVNESNSKWQANSNLPNLVNYHSTEFNILCPDKKNNYKTKQNIVEECKIINKNNSSSIKNMFFNPTHKQKGLAEFIDITQNGSGNPGREFVKSYKNNPLCFQKNSDVCGTFGDIHLDYKNICLRPFVKDKIIK